MKGAPMAPIRKGSPGGPFAGKDFSTNSPCMFSGMNSLMDAVVTNILGEPDNEPFFRLRPSVVGGCKRRKGSLGSQTHTHPVPCYVHSYLAGPAFP